MSRDTSPLRGRVAFLVGVRRSGTNWLRRIVDAHPDAAVIPGETYLFSHGVAPLAERVQHGLPGSAQTSTVYVDRDEFLDATRDLCDRVFASHLDTLDVPPHVVAERTPDHVRHLDLIGDGYPDAPVVHIVRDARDVARSLVSQPWGPDDHREAAREWVSGIEAARRARPHLRRYLEVRYEDLLSDPLQHVPEVYRFLDLDDGDEVVQRALTEASVPYNVDPASGTVAAAKWRDELDPPALRYVLDEAGDLQAELGYDVGPGRPRRTSPVQRVGAVGAAVRRRVGRAVRRDRDEALQRSVLQRLDELLVTVHALMDDVAARRFDDLERHFTPKARIRVVDGAATWDERGPDAVRRLAGAWADDPALAGRQVRGDVHPAVPAFTVVGTWEAGGEHHDRVLVVTCFGDRVDELTWYVLPRIPDDPPSVAADGRA